MRPHYLLIIVAGLMSPAVHADDPEMMRLSHISLRDAVVAARHECNGFAYKAVVDADHGNPMFVVEIATVNSNEKYWISGLSGQIVKHQAHEKTKGNKNWTKYQGSGLIAAIDHATAIVNGTIYEAKVQHDHGRMYYEIKAGLAKNKYHFTANAGASTPAPVVQLPPRVVNSPPPVTPPPALPKPKPEPKSEPKAEPRPAPRSVIPTPNPPAPPASPELDRLERMTLKNEITRAGYLEMCKSESSIPGELKQSYWLVRGLYTYLLSQRAEIKDHVEMDRLMDEAYASFSIAKGYGSVDAMKICAAAWTPGAMVAWEHARPRPETKEAHK